MAKGYEPVKAEEKPLVLISTLGTTELCMRRVREALEAEGCEVMVFHTTGAGGRTLEAIVAEREVAAVIDMSLVEVNDFIHDGICAVGPHRATTSMSRGVPTIFAPGNVDFFIMPSELAKGEAPFKGRDFHIHNATLTAVRTTEADLQLFTNHMAAILADTKGPVSFYIPLGGFSSHDSAEGKLHQPDLPPIFAKQCAAAFPDKVELHAINAHINDPAFADALIAAALPFIYGSAAFVAASLFKEHGAVGVHGHSAM